MTEELRLTVRGTQLVFPDGKPYCLVCGRTPTRSRRVWFETVMSTDALDGRIGAIRAGTQAVSDRISFLAPLCADHQRRATLAGLAGVACMLLALALIALGVVLAPKGVRHEDQADILKYVFMGLSLLPGGFGYFFWRRKDRGGLSCEARREGAALVLLYDGRAPKRPANR